VNPAASQIEFVPAGRGFVKIVMRHRSGDKTVEVLHYAEQGQMIGSEPVDVANARRLNEAAAELNNVLGSL
jgi:hypothetical protein